ncbi:hypothetical protein D6833_05555, partial [Candidatus Parcubacteria bacterium]
PKRLMRRFLRSFTSWSIRIVEAANYGVEFVQQKGERALSLAFFGLLMKHFAARYYLALLYPALQAMSQARGRVFDSHRVVQFFVSVLMPKARVV